MTPFPYAVAPDATLRQARTLMSEHDIRHLPVRDGEKLVGLLSDGDVRRALDPTFGSGLGHGATVAHAMVRDPYAVDLHAPLAPVLRELARRRIGSCLVTKEGRLVGIFTATDACRVFADHLAEQFPAPDDDDAA